MTQRFRVAPESSAAAVRLGIVGTVALVALALVALNFTGLLTLFEQRRFVAEFTEAGGIASGDDVVLSGVTIGKVTSVRLVTRPVMHVAVAFTVTNSDARLGDASGAAIKSKLALGKKVLTVYSAGARPLRPGAVIPTTRTTPAYDLTTALSDLPRTVEQIDTDQLAASQRALAGVLAAATPDLRPALVGTARVSQLIGDRDADLRALVAHSANVSGLLAGRSQQIRVLISDGNLVLAELNRRDREISELLHRATTLGDELSGLVTDNRARIAPELDQVNHLLGTLHTHKREIDDILDSAGGPLRALNDALGDAPGFSGFLPNLFTPVNTVPLPFVPQVPTGGHR